MDLDQMFKTRVSVATLSAGEPPKEAFWFVLLVLAFASLAAMVVLIDWIGESTQRIFVSLS
jgi:hypothetical protein